MANEATPRVLATPAALELIALLQKKHGEIFFHQSGGCCDGSAPIVPIAHAAGHKPLKRPAYKRLTVSVSVVPRRVSCRRPASSRRRVSMAFSPSRANSLGA